MQEMMKTAINLVKQVNVVIIPLYYNKNYTYLTILHISTLSLLWKNDFHCIFDQLKTVEEQFNVKTLKTRRWMGDIISTVKTIAKCTFSLIISSKMLPHRSHLFVLNLLTRTVNPFVPNTHFICSLKTS